MIRQTRITLKNLKVAKFASEETSCLFATMGFWQGVDIPGRALSLAPGPAAGRGDQRDDRSGPAARGRSVRCRGG